MKEYIPFLLQYGTRDHIDKALPHAGTYQLYKSTQTDNPELHEKIINHREVDTSILNNLARHNNPNVHKKILNHPFVNNDVLSKIVKHNNADINKSILDNPHTSSNVLMGMLANSDEPTREKVINHPNASDVLKQYHQVVYKNDRSHLRTV